MLQRFAFIPNRLTVVRRFELNVFPLNVLFVSSRAENGSVITGSAAYNPDLSSYLAAGGVQCMTYYNEYSRDWRLEIKYQAFSGRYEGVKYNRDMMAVAAFGGDWKTFFVNFTMRGLSNGEGCLFN